MLIVNAPGKVKRAPRLVRRDARRFRGIEHLSAVFVTEVADNDRADAYNAEGWTVTHDRSGPGKGECAIVTRDSRRKVLGAEWVKLTDGGGRGRLVHPIYAVVVITEGKSGRRTLLTGAHLPAHIEGIWARLPLPGRVKARRLLREGRVNPGILTWIEAVQNWRKAVADLAAEYHVDDVVVAPDGNVDARRPWVRQMLKAAWPGMHLVATKRPDLGRRTVGWVLTTMRGEGVRVIEQKSSDHRAGVYELHHVNAHPTHKPDPRLDPPDPFERCTYNGALMDQKTKTAIQVGEKRLGYSLTILQGCYHPGVSQSAGTHDGGQVIDFAPFDWQNKVRVFRQMGWFIWHRVALPGVWGEHIHGGIRNGGTLSPAAQQQQDDFDATPPRNGLADHAVDTSGLHPNPPVGFSYRTEWHRIND